MYDLSDGCHHDCLAMAAPGHCPPIALVKMSLR
jgi:uncharacterized protein with PQ loop repeat